MRFHRLDTYKQVLHLSDQSILQYMAWSCRAVCFSVGKWAALIWPSVVVHRNLLTPVVGGLLYLSLANHPADTEGSCRALWEEMSDNVKRLKGARVVNTDVAKWVFCWFEGLRVKTANNHNRHWMSKYLPLLWLRQFLEAVRRKLSCSLATCLDKTDGEEEVWLWRSV